MKLVKNLGNAVWNCFYSLAEFRVQYVKFYNKNGQ